MLLDDSMVMMLHVYTIFIYEACRETNSNFRITDPSNLAYLVSLHQLVGMRGLMAGPQG
jgi:hypothetical protein